MRYQATVFETLLKELPRHRFDRLVAHHNSDYRTRRLSSWGHLIAMIYGQLSGAMSLRDLETSLNSHGNLHYHLGTGPVRRSTLADANASRDPALFEEVFCLLLRRLQGQLRRSLKRDMQALGDAIRLLDATLLPLPTNRASWAGCWQKTTGAKAHVVYDPDIDTPVHFTVQPGRINDIIEGKKIPLEAGATYVFDRAYVDFAWWAAMAGKGCHFVTRLKTSSRYEVIEKRPAKGENILCDQTIQLSQRLARSRRNPYQGLLREVIVRDDQGRKLRLVTNLLAAPASKVAALYKTRWQIELFFKWIKQNLRIKRFLGVNLNAVRIQVTTAMIAFILIRLAKEKAPSQISMQSLTRLMRANLTHRKPWAKLFEPPPDPHSYRLQTNQISWSF